MATIFDAMHRNYCGGGGNPSGASLRFGRKYSSSWPSRMISKNPMALTILLFPLVQRMAETVRNFWFARKVNQRQR